MPHRGPPPEAIGVAALALHNVAVHRLLPAPAGAALSLVTAAGLTSFATRSGCSPADLGIRAEDARSGARMGLAAAAVAAGSVALAAWLPTTGRFFADRRVDGIGRPEAAYDLVVRIPFATAFAEELLFRGALLALFRQRHASAVAVLWTSLLFGVSHVLPTISQYDGNPVSDLVRDRDTGRRLTVVVTTLSTAGAGGVFAWLRLRSDSLIAPILAHAAINTSAYLAGRRVLQRQAGAAAGGRR